MLFSELKDKEVVCLSSGARLGCIDDIEFDDSCARVERFIIYGRSEILGLGPRLEDITIEWHDVEKIGSDIVLVSSAKELTSKTRKRK